jgi:hypothetical protein
MKEDCPQRIEVYRFVAMPKSNRLMISPPARLATSLLDCPIERHEWGVKGRSIGLVLV